MLSLLVVCLAVYVAAPKDNIGVESSVLIEDATIQSLFYADFYAASEVHYYSFSLEAGAPIHLSLFKPIADADALLLPKLVVIGPSEQAGFNLTTEGIQDALPEGTLLPPGTWSGLLLAPVLNETDLVYEPFVPSSYEQFQTIVRVNATVGGTFHALVFHSTDFGTYGYPKHFGLQVGNATSYSAAQLVALPTDSFSIHTWERQDTPELVMPVFLAAVGLLAVLVFRSLWLQTSPATISEWLLSLGGVCYWISAINYWYQMLRAASMTGESTVEPVLSLLLGAVHAVFSVGPLIVGLDSLDRAGEFVWWWRLLLIGQSVGSLFVFGAGYYLGPILVFIACVTPDEIGYTTLRELVYGYGEEVAYYYDEYYYELITVPPARPVRQSHRSASRLKRNRQGWNY